MSFLLNRLSCQQVSVNQGCCLLRLPWLFGFRFQVSGFTNAFFVTTPNFYIHLFRDVPFEFRNEQIVMGHPVSPLTLTPDT
jgi:hypothetical protein